MSRRDVNAAGAGADRRHGGVSADAITGGLGTTGDDGFSNAPEQTAKPGYLCSTINTREATARQGDVMSVPGYKIVHLCLPSRKRILQASL